MDIKITTGIKMLHYRNLKWYEGMNYLTSSIDANTLISVSYVKFMTRQSSRIMEARVRLP